MGSNQNFDAQKTLEKYIHDYLVKKNLHETAEIFKQDADVVDDPVGENLMLPDLNNPEGFLHEWWSTFYEMYNSREQQYLWELQQKKLKEMAEADAAVKRFLAEQLEKNQMQNAYPSPSFIGAVKALSSPSVSDFALDSGMIHGRLDQSARLLNLADPAQRLVKARRFNLASLSPGAGPSNPVQRPVGVVTINRRAAAEEESDADSSW